MHGMPVGLLLEEMVKEHRDIPGLEWMSQDWEGDELWPAYEGGEKAPRLDPRT